MLRRLVAIAMAALAIGSAAASDEMMCVQQKLTDLGYAPGPADGAIGRRSRDAAEMFAADTGTPLPALTDENAAAWCESLTAFADSPAAAFLTSPARALLPADVLIGMSRQPAEIGANLCKPRALGLEGALAIEPIIEIAGFNSRMDNIESVAHARDLERFAAAFGARSVLALATNDAALKAELVKTLARWAEAGATLGTISCIAGDGSLINQGACTEWTQDDGQDPSGMKDATFTTFIGAGLVRAYYAALADADPAGLATEHAAIKDWIAKWSKRLKRPEQVYFGLNMGWYWPTIVNELAAGKTDQARARLAKIADEMIRLINDDGSIKERTTRGNRALWYHYTSIDEIVVSMELMRAAGMTPPAELEEDLYRAVAVFIGGVKDHSSLDEWAKLANNSVYDGTQDWNRDWFDNDFAGTWLHIYPYRYAGTAQAAELRALVPPTSRSATTDIDLGLGLGCLYNTAIYNADVALEPLAGLTMSAVMVGLVDDETNFQSFRVNPVNLFADGARTNVAQIEVLADFDGVATPANLRLLRLSVPRLLFREAASKTADFSACDPISVRVDGKQQHVRFAYGEDRPNNECIFEKLGEQDRKIWKAVHGRLTEVLAQSKDQAARDLEALYAAVEN